MHMRKRRQAILKALSDHHLVTVRELSAALGASEATIRRDIHELAEANLLRRVHGGAEAVVAGHPHSLATRPFEVSQTLNVDRKRAVARAAAALCRDGESIIVNGGTTTSMMVEFLLERRLSILTNSLAIADPLIRMSANRIILPGGEVYREQNIILSPFDADAIQGHYASRMFTSAMGIGPLGVMEGDPLLVRSEQKLLAQADELVVIADSSKFRQRASLILCPLARVDTLITDDGVDEAAVAMLEQAGVRVVVVPTEAAATSAA